MRRLHQHIQTPEEERERIWEDWDAFLDGWIDAEKGYPCYPPSFYSWDRKRLYTDGYLRKRRLMFHEPVDGPSGSAVPSARG